MKKTFSRITKNIKDRLKQGRENMSNNIADTFYGRVKKERKMVEANKDADSLKYTRNMYNERESLQDPTVPKNKKKWAPASNIPNEYQENAEIRANQLKKGIKKIGEKGDMRTGIPDYKESMRGVKSRRMIK